MKLVGINCPNCAAPVQIPEGKNTFFCTFCGTQIQVDDGKISIDLNVTKRIIDEAKLKELEMKEQQRIREEEKQVAAEQQKKAQQLAEKEKAKQWLIAYAVWVFIGTIIVTIMATNTKSVDSLAPVIMGYLILIPIAFAAKIPSMFIPSKQPLTSSKKAFIYFVLMLGGGMIMSLFAVGVNSLISH